MTHHRRAWSLLLALTVGLAATPAFARGRRGNEGTRLIIRVDSRLSQAERTALTEMLGLDSIEDLANIDLLIIDVPAGQMSAFKAKLRGYSHVQDVEEDFYVNWLKMDSAPNFSNLMGQLPKF